MDNAFDRTGLSAINGIAGITIAAVEVAARCPDKKTGKSGKGGLTLNAAKQFANLQEFQCGYAPLSWLRKEPCRQMRPVLLLR